MGDPATARAARGQQRFTVAKHDVGAMDDIDPAPARRWLATGTPARLGWKAKSVSWLFITMPATRCRLPKTVSTDAV